MRLTGAITQWQSPMQSSVRLQFDLRMRENSWIGFFQVGIPTVTVECNYNVRKHAQM